MKKEKQKWSEMTKKQKVIHIIDWVMKSIILIIITTGVIYGIVYNAKDRGKIARANVVGGDIGISTPTNSNNVVTLFGKKYAINHYEETQKTAQVIWSLGDVVNIDTAKIRTIKDQDKDKPTIMFYSVETKTWDYVYYFDCEYGIYDRPGYNVYIMNMWAYNENKGVYNTRCGFAFYPYFEGAFPSFGTDMIVRIKSKGSFDLAFNYKEPIFDYENTETGDMLGDLNIMDSPDFPVCKALMCTQNPTLTADKIFSNAYEEGYMTGTDEGYTEGENAGYENGYNYGYNKGYEEGRNQATTFNPIGMMIEPVAKLLDVKIFGEFSIGNFFTAALFVTLAISFMKMFAGG